MKFQTPGKRNQNIIFHVDGLLQMVPIREIIYIQSKDHKLYITTIPYKSCNAILKELDCEDFVKCNRGTIVNMSYIKKVDTVNRYIYLRGCKDVLDLGSIMIKSFMHQLKK